MRKVVFIAYAIYVVNLLVVGPAHTRVFVGATLALAVAFASALVWSRANPLSATGRVLLTARGPRTDVLFMSRAELVSSGLVFLGWGSLLFSVYVGLLFKLNNRLFDSTPLASLASGFMFGGLMGLAGGAYLLLRGLLRSSHYRPPSSAQNKVKCGAA